MRKKWWLAGGVVAVGVAIGCSSSNPYKPTMFSRNRMPPAGPELGPPINDGPMMNADAVPFSVPPGAIMTPPAGQPPIQAFPPGATPAPQGPNPVPQGPPPRPQGAAPTGRGA